MRRFLSFLSLQAVGCLVAVPALALAQTPTYAPTSPLVAPGEPGTTIPSTSVPTYTPPQTTVPSTTPGTLSPVPEGTYSVPNGSTVDPAATIVTPGTAPAYNGTWGAWYPGFWLGYRAGAPPYGGGPVPYQTNYQGGVIAPYGGGGCGPCNTCPTPCAPQNLDFGRGYDGFMTGW